MNSRASKKHSALSPSRTMQYLGHTYIKNILWFSEIQMYLVSWIKKMWEQRKRCSGRMVKLR